MLRRLTLVAALLYSLAAVLPAQEFRATVTGHVTDPTGAAIPKVTVQITNIGTNEVAAAVTNNQGIYSLPFLKPGTYRLTAEVAGFKKYVKDNIVLNVGDTAGIDLAMEVGQNTESVTVVAEALGLQTESADHGLVIDQKRVSELPLNARNPFMLAMLSAGVNFSGNQIYQRPFDNGAIADWTVNGGLDRKNEFLLDGAPNNAQAGGNNIALVPPVDSVQEFKIQTNSFDAAYGKSSGGIMNVSLKGGTNQFHGTLYEYMRRNALDANSFQNNSAGAPKSGHFLDQYGGSIGGPIIIPKIYNGRNRSFFFGNYEGYREGTPTPLTLSVPEPEWVNGDFSKLVNSQGRLITIYDPQNAVINQDQTVTRQPFPNNQIPKERLNPIAQKLMSYFPKPNTVTPGSAYGTNDLFYPGGAENLDKDDFYNMVLKFDQQLGDKHHLFFREASNDRTEHRNTNGVLGLGWQGPGPLKRLNDAYVLDWVGAVRPTFLLGGRVSFARYVEGSRGDPNIGTSPTVNGFPASLVAQLPIQNIFGTYNFTNYAGLGSTPSFNYTNTVAFAGSLTKIVGSHSIKAGIDLRRIMYNVVNQGNVFTLTFNNTWTQQIYNTADALSGNSFASALLGLPASGTVDNNAFPSFVDRYYAGYVQDDWKVTRKLTLNLGIRWDFIQGPTERYGRLTRGFDPTAVNPVDSLIDRKAFPGFPTVKGGLLFVNDNGDRAANLDKTGIQPRFGLAYQITNKLVFRGGWGRYMINPNNDWNRTEGFSVSTSVINSNNGGRTPIANLLNNPFPSGILQPVGKTQGLATLLGQSPDFFDPTFHTPYTDQFTVGFQYELPLHSRLEISYVGNRGYKLQTARPYNQADLSFRQTCDPLEGGSPTFCNQLVPNPFFGLPQFAGTALGTNATVSRSTLAQPFPQFSSLNQRGRNDGKTWYNAIQLDYGIRATKGLNLTFAYTFSKNIEQGGFDNSNGNNANNAFIDVQRFIYERSLTGYDFPQVVKMSSVYELPFGRGKHFLGNSGRLVDAFLGGWQHTMILQYRSGAPWNLPGNAFYIRNAAVDTDWASAVIHGVNPCVAKMSDTGVIALQSYSVGVPGCSLSTINFLEFPNFAPARGTPLRTGDIRTQSLPVADMSIGKRFKITESKAFQFRAEAFNVFNSFWMSGGSGSNGGHFSNNLDSAAFGQLVKGTVATGSTNWPRQIQLGFKFLF
jgi:hypothetical protein